ncbi:acyl--CoA ligase [Bacillus coahuilensis p1.1.43]|uniref:Acyl--CoA ligase n=1 Tax=Bacillus coahuilensis p1.1.43 TaxID=1150625 RepID=A0A147K6G8_9BACI|nr:acyl--CoA ligase [Bacillus coahuilensis]KUP05495.1 acyl--CoA ligase [Bacillus coahuilensis p1.1.43]
MVRLIAPSTYNMLEEVEKFNGSNRVALIIEEATGEHEQVTYEQLISTVNKIGNVFLGRGLRKGDKALVIVPRGRQAYEIYLALLKIGVVIIPCSEMLRAKDLMYRIDHSEAKAVICDEHLVSCFDEVDLSEMFRFIVSGNIPGFVSLESEISTANNQLSITPTSRDDLAFLSYTSGTTGNPKGVSHTHGWAYAHIRTAAKDWLSIVEGDTVWATAGPGWQKWVWSPFLSVLGSGATGLVYKGKFEPKTFLSLLDKHNVNVLCCTPTEYRLMAKVEDLSHYSLSSLHSAVSAGEPLNREVIDTFHQHFSVEVRDGYGQTENTLLVGTLKGMKIKPGSMGKPTPGNRVEIINEEGVPCEVGEVGDIAVHRDTPALFKEYYKDRERTLMQFRGDYYITGDKAKRDEDGYFWFEGRGDDIIISSGYTIGPFEVEDALIKHPLVKECAVVASPDEIRGHIVKAFVVLTHLQQKEEETTIELQNHVKRLTAPYKYPRIIEYLEELPKTTSGKIRRVDLRNKELENKR